MVMLRLPIDLVWNPTFWILCKLHDIWNQTKKHLNTELQGELKELLKDSNVKWIFMEVAEVLLLMAEIRRSPVDR